MQRIDLMTYSDVMRVYKRRRRNPYHFAEGVLPKDKSWQVALLAVAVIGGFLTLFVRWWLCV